MAAVLTGGTFNPTVARAGPEKEEKTVSEPYSDNLVQLIKDQQMVREERENVNASYSQNLDDAEKSIKEMEAVSDHLLSQQKKYPDYSKIEGNIDQTDDNIERAKGLLLENTGAMSTGEYKYGIEVTPDALQQQEVNDRFSQIAVLSEDTKDQDMTVDKYRGFYDLSKTRKTIVKKALSEKGKISYLWGSKSLSMDEPKALDCSGFVRWVYHYATGKDYDTMLSTSLVDRNYDQISHNELKPGDIGMKNEDGTCYVSADGDKFSTVKEAQEDNEAHNKKVKKEIKKLKKDMKADIKDIKDNLKKDIADIKKESASDKSEKDDGPDTEKNSKDDKDNGKPKRSSKKKTDSKPDAGTSEETEKASKEKDGNQPKEEAASDDSTSEQTVQKADRTVGVKRSSKQTADRASTKDSKSRDNDKASKKSKASKAKDDRTPEEKISDAKKAAGGDIKALKKSVAKEIKDLKKDLVKEDDVHQQIGHIGIYAGKDKNGNDTWVHCTGGNKDTVVVTTEEEYDGFKYYYSPLSGVKSNDATQNIKTDSGVPEADYEVEVPADLDYQGTKTYERYTAIRAKSSLQYKLQTIANTDPSGFRTVNDRYLIAVGTGVTSDVGRYVDVILDNDTVIPCIVGDIKSDKHTEKKYRIMTRASHCVSEFIVDGDLIKASIGGGGDVSAYTSYWDSPVKKFVVYKNRIKL